MCPACLTTLLLVAGGTGSTGGLAALAIRRLWGVTKPPPASSDHEDPKPTEPKTKRIQ